MLGYKAEDLKDMVQNLSETVGELTLDNDTAIINKSDADSSSSEKVCLFVGRSFASYLCCAAFYLTCNEGNPIADVRST